MSIYDINGVELNTAYDVNGTELTDVYDVDGNRLGFDRGVQWLDSAELTNVPSAALDNIAKQGMCSDGTYIYQAGMPNVSSGNTDQKFYIIKLKIADGTYTIKEFDDLARFGHANDMTYNPLTNCLYIPTMKSDGSVIVLDADTLDYVNTVYLLNSEGNGWYVWQLSYDRTRNVYYATYDADGDDSFIVYDSSFNYVRRVMIPAQISGSLSQGADTDGVYYYRQTDSPDYIQVCTLDGTEVANVSAFWVGEQEGFAYAWNGKYYMSRSIYSPWVCQIKMYNGTLPEPSEV